MHIMFDSKCIIFRWFPKISLNNVQCGNQNAIIVQKITEIIQSIFRAVTLNKYPNFLFCSRRSRF